MIEQTNELVRRMNRICERPVLVEVEAVVGAVGRLPGIDGAGKMGKSSGNSIPLSASADAIVRQVRAMTPWPSAFTWLHGRRIIVDRALARPAPPGRWGIG